MVALSRAAMFAFASLAIGLPAFAGETPEAGRESSGHVSYAVGAKRLGSGWEGAEGNFVFGLLDFEGRGVDWPVSFAARFTIGYSPNVPEGAPAGADFSGAWEFDLGIRKTWGRCGAAEPFIGAGAAVIGASTTWSFYGPYGGSFYDQTASDAAVGPYVEAGVYWTAGKKLHLGILGSWSTGDVDLGEASLDAGGTSILFLIGGRWEFPRPAGGGPPVP